jgi:hypothetical protein
MGITVGQPAAKPAATFNDDDLSDWVDDPDNVDGEGDGDSPQVEDCEDDLSLTQQEIAFNEGLQAAEAAEEQAAIAKQIATNAAQAGARNRADQTKIGNTRTTVTEVRSQGWLQRDPGQLSATVQRTLMQMVGDIPRTELLTGAPVTVRLGQKTFDVSVQADPAGSLSVSCQGQSIGSLPAATGSVGGNARVA